MQGIAASGGPTAPSQGAGQAGGQPEADPALGIGYLCGNRDRPRPGRDISPVAGQSRAVGSWGSALLQHHWGRD